MLENDETIDKILKLAKDDDAIRAVMLNGSRANKEALKDPFQDYDIVYYVKNDISLRYKDFSKLFDEILIMQTLDDMVFDPYTDEDSMVYLMQFKNGKRIDLTIRKIKNLLSDYHEDSLSVILLDKDNHIKSVFEPSLKTYYIKKPDQVLFASCINEFYWVSLYVSKGVLRNQLTYAIDHLNIIRKCLKGMIDWDIAYDYNYEISLGKNNSLYPIYLSASDFYQYTLTYPNFNAKAIIESLFNMIELFHKKALSVSEKLNYTYNELDYYNVKAYISNQIEVYNE
ncbi:MAG: aminoglycoside 6-adenylyltransferase [Candidatus Izemoplasmataceae bacterium]